MTAIIRTILLIVIVIQITNITDVFSQYGWIQQSSGINSRLNSVQFKNFQTGWCAGDNGIVLKTSNGGSNWFQQETGTSYDLHSITFVSLETGYAVGDTGTILKTINGGENWFQITLTNNTNFYSLDFVNDTVGFTGGFPIVEHKPTSFYKTTNGGITWDSTEVGKGFSYNYISQIQFLTPLTGWIVAGLYAISGENLFKTTNGGINWVNQYGQPTWKVLNVFFVDSLYGWLSGQEQMNEVIYRTTNGGTNWQSSITSLASSIYFVNRNKGWAAGKFGGIQATTNGGINWISQFFQSGIEFHSIFFTDSLTGWCVGDSGRILKTTTGGLTYISNNNSEISDDFFLSQNYPNPFNPETRISYSIPLDAKRKIPDVRLVVYDALGKKVSTLVNEQKSPGSYEVVFDGSNLPSGIYFYRLTAGDYKAERKMVLLK